ncbi:hypothetical protein DE146DRAFT_627699 [Phaeosphaeria sp. MPI-PUGE-AT-0046c]|nr:hypothetical protein DE146DRAFT_627699 [Phaeosphaeria sp. MPI-PUGE-AT-0046c]
MQESPEPALEYDSVASDDSIEDEQSEDELEEAFDGPAVTSGTNPRKCAGCGEVGHIKTNKVLCPLLIGQRSSARGAPPTNDGEAENDSVKSSHGSDYVMQESSDDDEWDHDQGCYVMNVVGRGPNTAYHALEAHFNALAPGTVNDNPHRPQDAHCARPDGYQVIVLTYTRDKLTGQWANLEKDIPPW